MLNVLKAATGARKRQRAAKASAETPAMVTVRMASKVLQSNPEFTVLDSVVAGLAKACSSGSDTDRGKIYALCSIDQGEGKSTVAMALATALAHRTDRQVLLVEADLRSPSLAVDMDRTEAPGLGDFLRDNVSLNSAIQPTPVDRLSILTAGSVQRNISPEVRMRISVDEAHHLLNQPALRTALDELRSQYALILVDLPALSGGEAIPLMELLDGVMLVVKAGQTSKDRVERAVKLIGEEKLVGVVLNQVRHSAPWWLRRILSDDEDPV